MSAAPSDLGEDPARGSALGRGEAFARRLLGAGRRAAGIAAPAAAAAVIAAVSARWMESGVAAAAGVAAAVALGAGVAVRREREQSERRRLASVRRRRAARRRLEAEEDARPPVFAEATGVLDSLPAALVLLDERDRIAFANRDLVELVGRDPTGGPIASAFRAPDFVEAIARSRTERAPADAVFSTHRGGERHYRALIRPVDGDAPSAATCILLLDQTRARRAERLQRDFVANASHELKTPLASISGFIETLRGPARGDAPAQERFLEIMAGQTDRMARLVSDLLALNRIELSEHLPPREPIDLRDALEDALAMVAPDRDAIDLVSPEPAPRAPGDRAELAQAFANLIDNALKYGGRGRRPEIRFLLRSGHRPRVGVAVRDFGPGISAEHVPRLTERFYRVEGGGGDRSGRPSGTGLGLAIVERIGARHRGELQVESRPGWGSRFTLWLPRAGEDESSV